MHEHLSAKVFFATALIFIASACGESESTPVDAGDGAVGDGVSFVDVGETQDRAMEVDSGVGADAQGEAGLLDGAGACMVWEITYELTGSVFELSATPFGAGDQVNTLTTPYDANDHVGPGTIVMRFQDVGGSPGGLAAISAYTMAMHFVVDGVTKVATDLDATAGPSACGVTTGELEGNTVTWDPSALVGHHSVGQVLCTGALCSFGGLPNGDPVPIDETNDHPLSDFVFASDLKTFSMAKTVIAQDNNSTSTWQYEGAETERKLVAAPACLCP